MICPQHSLKAADWPSRTHLTQFLSCRPTIHHVVMCLRGFRAAFISDFLAVVRAFLLRPIALGWATRRAVRWVFGAGPTLLFFTPTLSVLTLRPPAIRGSATSRSSFSVGSSLRDLRVGSPISVQLRPRFFANLLWDLITLSQFRGQCARPQRHSLIRKGWRSDF